MNAQTLTTASRLALALIFLAGMAWTRGQRSGGA